MDYGNMGEEDNPGASGGDSDARKAQKENSRSTAIAMSKLVPALDEKYKKAQKASEEEARKKHLQQQHAKRPLDATGGEAQRNFKAHKSNERHSLDQLKDIALGKSPASKKKPALPAVNKASTVQTNKGNTLSDSKKAASVNDVSVAALQKNPKSYFGHRLAKYFGDELYFGTVDGFEPAGGDEDALWHVTYDDGDQEDLDAEEMVEHLTLWSKNKSQDKK